MQGFLGQTLDIRMHNIMAGYFYYNLWIPKQYSRSEQITELSRYFFNNPFLVVGHLVHICGTKHAGKPEH